MNTLDKQYLDLLQDILDNGVKKEDRTGTGTISVFGRTIRHKMSEGFPLLTTKEVWFKGVATELLWFLRGDTNIQSLVKQGNYIWVGDAYKRYSNPSRRFKYILSKSEFIEKIKTDDEFAKKWGDMGPIYGKQWRHWETKEVPNYDELNKVNYRTSIYEPPTIDQIQQAIDTLRTNPDSRRIMVNAWNVDEIDNMVLPPCHYGFQFYTRELSLDERFRIWFDNKKPNRDVVDAWDEYTDEGKHNHLNTIGIPKRAISLMFQMRSTDVGLGLPFNLASYGLLLLMIADEVNMIPDELIYNGGDVHIYENHIDALKEQLKRESYPLPNVYVRDGIFSSYDLNDIVLENYKHHPSIKMPLSN